MATNRFGLTQTRMRRGQVELEVWRDGAGQFHKAPAGMRGWVALQAAAARAKLTERNRTGRRLMTLDEVDTRWYMVRGPKRWVRRGKVPGWHHGYYYDPGVWWPVVPPGSAWSQLGALDAPFTPETYRYPPGTPMVRAVPDDVLKAASATRAELKGQRGQAQVTARSERYQGRRARAGVGQDRNGRMRRAKGLRVTSVGGR